MTRLTLSLCCVATLGGLSAVPPAAAVSFNLLAEPGTPAAVMEAFNTAANRWSAVLTDNITVNVQIGFAALGNTTIGQTIHDYREYSYADTVTALTGRRVSADDYSSVAALSSAASFNRLINRTTDHPNGAGSAIPYLHTTDRVGMTTANAKVLGLLGATSSLDAAIRFNSDFAFDFNPTDGVSAGYYDFVGAATHELGHALGFISGLDDLDRLPGLLPGADFTSSLLDLFRFSMESLSFGLGVSDFTADARQKFFSVDGGLTALVPFATGITFGDGYQAGHWNDAVGNGLMSPTLNTGELLTITGNDLRALDVLGYTVLIPEPASGTLLLLGGVLLLRQLIRPGPADQTSS
jgi:hypothetical protein